MLLRNLHRRTKGRTGGSECHYGIHGTAAPDAAPAVKTAMYTAAMGEKRQAERYGTIQHLFDAGAESPVATSGEDDGLFTASDLRADRLQIVFHHALPRRCQPAAKAALTTGCFLVCVNDGKTAGIGQNSGEYVRY